MTAPDTCSHGHPWTPATTGWQEGMQRRRVCLVCAAERRRADTCRRGHPFTPENTLLRGRGRACRTCIRDRYKARWAERRAEPLEVRPTAQLVATVRALHDAHTSDDPTRGLTAGEIAALTGANRHTVIGHLFALHNAAWVYNRVRRGRGDVWWLTSPGANSAADLLAG